MVQNEACLAKLSRRRVQHGDLLLHIILIYAVGGLDIRVLIFILVVLLLLEQVRLMILMINDLLLGLRQLHISVVVVLH